MICQKSSLIRWVNFVYICFREGFGFPFSLFSSSKSWRISELRQSGAFRNRADNMVSLDSIFSGGRRGRVLFGLGLGRDRDVEGLWHVILSSNVSRSDINACNSSPGRVSPEVWVGGVWNSGFLVGTCPFWAAYWSDRLWWMCSQMFFLSVKRWDRRKIWIFEMELYEWGECLWMWGVRSHQKGGPGYDWCQIHRWIVLKNLALFFSKVAST